MKKFVLTAIGGLILCAGLPAAAQISVRIGPPRRPVEVVPVRPVEHPNWVWQPGYHRWDGGRYVWVPGTYVEPPYEHARWVPGHWAHRGGGWIWIEGHWRR